MKRGNNCNCLGRIIISDRDVYYPWFKLPVINLFYSILFYSIRGALKKKYFLKVKTMAEPPLSPPSPPKVQPMKVFFPYNNAPLYPEKGWTLANISKYLKVQPGRTPSPPSSAIVLTFRKYFFLRAPLSDMMWTVRDLRETIYYHIFWGCSNPLPKPQLP